MEKFPVNGDINDIVILELKYLYKRWIILMDVASIHEQFFSRNVYNQFC